jgi:hypothetical protein
LQEPKQKGRSNTSTVRLIAFFSLLGAYGYSEHTELLTEVRTNRETITDLLLSEPDMQSITTTWVDGTGNTRSVTTTQAECESWADTPGSTRRRRDRRPAGFPAGRVI